MMQLHSKITDMCPSLRQAVRLSTLLVTLTVLTACSMEQPDDIAVAKLPQNQIQTTFYLPLNPDKPGTPLHVERYLVPGRYTIVHYFSPYDGASVNIANKLVQLLQTRNDLALRTVNVNRPGVQGIDWQSPIMQNRQISALPYFQIYDPKLGLRAHGRPAAEQIAQWVQYVPN